MAWLTGPVISFMASVISTVGGWTIVTGLIALALNSLCYIKNLNDAGNAQNTDELLAESSALKENMTDAAGNLMAVVGAKGDVAGAKMLKKNIAKGGGSKQFFKNKGQMQGKGIVKTVKNAPGNVVKMVKGAPGKVKKMTTGSVTKVRSGIKKTLDRFKKTDKPNSKIDAPNNKIDAPSNKADGPDKVKKIKDKNPNSNKTTTTKGLKEGGDLGSVGGQKVKAEMEFPDGHKAKALNDGQCAICSNCQKIKTKYAAELAENPQVSGRLKKVETELKTLTDMDSSKLTKAQRQRKKYLIKEQKSLHDTLEIKKNKKTQPDADADANVNTTQTNTPPPKPAKGAPGSPEHRAQRWKEYLERKKDAGEKPWKKDRWDKTYDVNMKQAAKANKAMDTYHGKVGWGKREVTVEIDGVKRRLDIADPKKKKGIEHKTGYQTANETNLAEIVRDAALMKKKKWKIEWVFDGATPSKPLLAELSKHGIPYKII